MDIGLKVLLGYTILNGAILSYDLAFNILSAMGIL